MRSFLKKLLLALKTKRYVQKFPNAVPGSTDWLIGAEIIFGGFHTNVPRNKVSPHDPRSHEEVLLGGMTGGDRFLHHGYAKHYARFLEPFIKQSNALTLIEVGILRGTGLAVWSELFPHWRIIGLDIDLSHFQNNRQTLISRGAFKTNTPEVYEFDQFVDNKKKLASILNDGKIDVFIDDGFHSNEAILSTMESVMPFLNAGYVYFIEDNKHVHEAIRKNYSQVSVYNVDRLTVVTSSI